MSKLARKIKRVLHHPELYTIEEMNYFRNWYANYKLTHPKKRGKKERNKKK